MKFEFTPTQDFNFINDFAKQLGVNTKDDFIKVPANMGAGFIKRIFFDNNLSLLIHKYQLHDDLFLYRHAPGYQNDRLTFRFYEHTIVNKNQQSYMQILSSNVNKRIT